MPARTRPGDVYLGVGPEQNFTYIAAVKPSMAVIFDIRRGNLHVQLMYKALFELAADRADFLSSLGLESAGLDRLIQAGYKLLGLETYFTAGEQEVRAWTIHRGDTAPKAAAVIHTDFERGFIRAETVAYDAFVNNEGWKGAREKGVVRSEGKEYVVQDGDVLLFRFNV